jgi:Fe-S cluster assembly protein SufD
MTPSEIENRKAWYGSQFAAFERNLNGGRASSVHRTRRASMERFNEIDFPTARSEDWKYTSLDPLLQYNFAGYSTAEDLTPATVEPYVWGDTPHYRLTFVNGRHVASSSRLPEGGTPIRIRSLGKALEEDPQGIDDLLRSMPEAHDPFTLLNTAFLLDGAVIDVPDGIAVDKAIHLLFLSAPDERALATYPRVILRVGREARVSVSEHFASVTPHVHFTNVVTQMAVGADAAVDYHRIQDENPSSFQIGLTQIVQARRSRVHSTVVTLGGRLTRNFIHLLADEHIESTLNGLYLTRGRQHADHRTLIDHAKPHGTTHELYKGILDGHSTGVFNGKIIVRPDAQKTDAKQSNNNILLSEDATVNTRPQLEIFADDVKCTHGATVGRIDEDALFYLQTRGLNAEAARNLLTYAFAGEILERIQVPALREKLNATLRDRLQH